MYMNWTETFDIYCERTDLSYWSEPVNAVTNAAFLIAAVFMWSRVRGQNMPIALGLCAILAAISLGSYLFHTHATAWASAADTTPIGLFILLYLFAVGLHFLRLPWWGAVLLMLSFLPFAYVAVPLLDQIPFIEISNFYWTVPILLVAFAPFVARKNAKTARGMLIGAGILVISIIVRSVDLMLCDAIPLGTHFGWHVLNAIMLGWMIEVYRRHTLEYRAAQS